VGDKWWKSHKGRCTDVGFMKSPARKSSKKSDDKKSDKKKVAKKKY
jgi:hypothetical protein